jgi:hypothetical protein
MAAAKCSFCEETSPPTPKHGSHRACAEAWGLDFNPRSDAEARVWLDRRRCQFGQRRRWTIGLPRAVLLWGSLQQATKAFETLRKQQVAA